MQKPSSLFSKTDWFKHFIPDPPWFKPRRNKISSPISFVPCIQLQFLFTPLSGFFSSFVHTTCLLSVFRPYLALWESYLTFSAQFPMYATLQKHWKLKIYHIRLDTGLSPFIVTLSRIISNLLNFPQCICKTTIRLKKSDFNFELLHLHSPLLMESLLFSFPGVNDMLKFAP